MPIYEFRCQHCARRFQALVGMVADAPPPACPGCGSSALQRLISRFTVGRDFDRRLDDLTDPSALSDPDNPRQVQEWIRRAGAEMGDDVGEDVGALMEEAFEEESCAQQSDPDTPSEA